MSAAVLSVVCRLGTQLYGLPAARVAEMVELPLVTHVPGVPAPGRGVLNLRGRLVPVRDTRELVGLRSLPVERAEINLPQRRRDHLNWVAELAASVAENRPFKLTTDPHGCAFGKWYDQFQTPDLWLQRALEPFDEPHKALHATAVTVTELVAQGRRDEALAAVDVLRETHLARLQELFAAAELAVERAYREVAVIVDRGGDLVALTADAVVAIEPLRPADDAELELPALVTSVARRAADEHLVMLLNAEADSPLLRSDGVSGEPH